MLRAYEAWGEKSPDRIIGEFVFFIWDSRQQRLFGARDAAGTRHFYYCAGKGWFGFASEIKGLLATGLIEARLNESRVFDYLVSEYDRDDQVGTFYQGINRMPAGHAMAVTPHGSRTWRYWEPGNLPPMNFKSLDECAEAFREQFRIAVKCRLRSIGPVGAMLSGGLDSSSIVGLIGKEFRGDLQQPLKTFSLIREDRENCKDWQHIQEMLKEGWIEPTIIDSSIAGDVFRSCLDSIPNTDEPFALSHGLTYSLIYEAARQNGCRIVLDGMAGDLLFYSLDRSLDLILRRKMLAHVAGNLCGIRPAWHGKPPANDSSGGRLRQSPPRARAPPIENCGRETQSRQMIWRCCSAKRPVDGWRKNGRGAVKRQFMRSTAATRAPMRGISRQACFRSRMKSMGRSPSRRA